MSESRKTLLFEVREEFKLKSNMNYSTEELIEFCDFIETCCDECISHMVHCGMEYTDSCADLNDTYNWVRYIRNLLMQDEEFDPRKEWGTL